MEAIQSTLNLTPVPGLSFAFAVFRTIYDAVMLAEENREQLMLLSETVATILRALDDAYRERRLDPQSTQSKIIELNGCVPESSIHLILDVLQYLGRRLSICAETTKVQLFAARLSCRTDQGRDSKVSGTTRSSDQEFSGSPPNILLAIL